MLGRTRRVHFVGIGGIGMSGIAELLANLGFAVTGSDLKRSDVTARLEGAGVTVHAGHQASHVGNADVVVVSSAVKPTNPEVAEAHQRGIPVIPRAEMLAELMRMKYSVAVAGSHGKTTTTSMIAFVLEQGGLDPTAVIGGRLSAFGGNARLGRGEYLVAEADESDRSFLMLWPTIAVVTNIDREHMESYNSFVDLQHAFAEFANKVPFYGSVVACASDPHVIEVLPWVKRPVVTYGLDDNAAQIVGTDVELGPFGARCLVHRRRQGTLQPLGSLELSVPGRHNLENALAAVAVGGLLGLSLDRVAAALRDFQGAERRFQLCGEVNGVLVVDDYGHHPTEIAAVLSAARASLGRRLVVVFQPHRYSRTARLMNEFGDSLKGADEILLTEIYPAGEDPLPGITGEALQRVVHQRSGRPVRFFTSLDAVVEALPAVVRPGDAVITLGAGSIGTLPRRILDALGQEGTRH